jgi:glycosyltransferase involved in cell wall biosynthesis
VKDKVRLSIIVPVYNTEKYINKCIDSILNQTFEDFEIILVDDGSPDKCGEICDQYAKQDMRVKVIHKKNGGLADARNAGIEIAKGDFIGFVDSDDYIKKDMYSEMLAAIGEYKVKIVTCGRFDVSNGVTTEAFVINKPIKMTAEEAIGNILTWNGLDSSCCDKIFEKSLFQEIRFPLGRVNEDIFIMYRLIDKAKTIVHIGSPKYYYVHRENSITTNSFSVKKLDFPIVTSEILNYMKNNYPNLVEEAMFFYFSSHIYILNILINEEKEKQYEVEFNKSYLEIRKNSLKFLKNKYINKKNKIKILLMIVGEKLFVNVMKMYNK